MSRIFTSNVAPHVAALFWPTSSITLLLQVVGALLILDAALTWFGVGRHRVIGGLGIGGRADRAGFADQAASGGLAGLSSDGCNGAVGRNRITLTSAADALAEPLSYSGPNLWHLCADQSSGDGLPRRPFQKGWRPAGYAYGQPMMRQAV